MDARMELTVDLMDLGVEHPDLELDSTKDVPFERHPKGEVSMFNDKDRAFLVVTLSPMGDQNHYDPSVAIHFDVNKHERAMLIALLQSFEGCQ